MRARPGSGRCRLAGSGAAAPAPGRDSSVGLSPAPIEAILDHQVSDTTLRAPSGRVDRRRGVRAGPHRSARGVRPDHRPRPGRRTGGRVAAPGPLRREGHRPQPTDRAKLGWKWSVAAGLDQFEIQRRGTRVPGVKRQPLRLGRRWIIEATNTWRSNYGQLRRNTDRRARHRPRRSVPRHHNSHRRPPHRLRNRWNST